MARSKYTYDLVKQEFNDRGYDLISDTYTGLGQKMEYICRKHKDKGVQDITFTKFHHAKQGCKYCGQERTIEARKAVLNKQEDENLCKSKNFTYVDTFIENHVVKILFLCNLHQELGVQTMNKTNMKRDIKGCKYCSGKRSTRMVCHSKSTSYKSICKMASPIQRSFYQNALCMYQA